MIIINKEETLKNAIVNDIKRGITILDGKGVILKCINSRCK